MLEDLTYEKKIHYQHCEECNVERMTYPHLGF